MWASYLFLPVYVQVPGIYSVVVARLTHPCDYKRVDMCLCCDTPPDLQGAHSMILYGRFGSASLKKALRRKADVREADLRETILWGEAEAMEACMRMRWLWRACIKCQRVVVASWHQMPKEESENAKGWFFAMMAILLTLADTLTRCRGPNMSKKEILLACCKFVEGLGRIRRAAFASYKEFPELVELIDAHCEILYERQQCLVDIICSAEFTGRRTEDLLQITIFGELFTNFAWWVFEVYVNGYRHHERGEYAPLTAGGTQERKRLAVCWTQYAEDRLAKTILALIPYTSWNKAKTPLEGRLHSDAIALSYWEKLHSDVMLLEGIVKNRKCYNKEMRPPVVTAIVQMAFHGIEQLLVDLQRIQYMAQNFPTGDEGTLFFSVPLPGAGLGYARIDAPMPDLMPYARSSRCHPDIKANARFLLQTFLRMHELAKLLPEGYSFPQGTVIWAEADLLVCE
jgi:hypothetical protein